MKRGESGLSFVVGVDKPAGLTSHDVVDRCRRIFGEKRIGHTGTLDPLASGAMAVCVGPATKLSNYLTFHDKAYAARIAFGAATDTDDAEGQVIREAAVPARIGDAEWAAERLRRLVGRHNQLPPAYSAIKVGGVKSYEAARKGNLIDLTPRPVEIYRAELIGVGWTDDGLPYWDARIEASAGTYIRSIARDLGHAERTCAHLAALRRLRSGRLDVGECVSPEALAADPSAGRLDPIALLGLRYLVADGERQRASVANGGKLGVRGLALYELRGSAAFDPACSPCTSVAAPSERPPEPGETLAVLVGNALAALYLFDGDAGCLKPRCVFAQGVSRGSI